MTKSIDEIIVTGELGELTTEQRVQHYLQVCDALDLDHRLHPLEYLWVDNLNGGRNLILYVLRNGTDQLRTIHGIEIVRVSKEIIDGVLIYTAEAKDKSGRTDVSTGAVSLEGKSGSEKANAFMACETKAKRRVTLSISGVGLLDETEVADMTHTRTVSTPGLAVSAPPPQISTPVMTESVAKEVLPAPAETPEHMVKSVRDSRINLYKLEVLQNGLMKSLPGQPIGMKWSKYILMEAPGHKSTQELTTEEWKVVLDKLDEIRAKTGDKGVVFHIEETIAKEKKQ